MLENENIDVIEAVNGHQVLEKLKHSIPDLILMDIQMPEIDGFQVAKRIKENKNLQNIPIVAVTAHATKGEINKFKLVFDEYLTKPITKKSLLKAIYNNIS